MKKNMGSTDRLIRTTIALLIAILYLTNVVTGTTALVLVGISLILFITSAIGFCPLYLPFGISTLKNRAKQ